MAIRLVSLVIFAATCAVAGDTYDYAGGHSNSGQRTNRWNLAASWTNGPQPFPNAPGDVVRVRNYINGFVTLELNQNITIGTLNWTGRLLEINPGNPPGRLTVNNLGLPAVWQVYAYIWFLLDADLTLKDSLTLSNTVELPAIEPARLGGIINGPGRLTLHWNSVTNNPFYLGAASNSAPNAYTGGTRLEGHSPSGGYFEPRKKGAFGTGDVELNGYAQLILRDGGASDDYVADSAALRLDAINITNRPKVYLANDVNEIVRDLYLDGVQQPAGTYGATGSGAAELNDDFFAGPGLLTVVAGPPNPGAIRNLPALDVTANRATLAGEVLATNTAPTSVYVFWGFSDGGCQPDAWVNRAAAGVSGQGVFSVSITNDLAGRIVYYRCYLTNSLGDKWANGTASFGTPRVQNRLPLVRTSHVTLRALALSTNGLPTQARVYWGTNDGGTISSNWQYSAALGTVSEGLLTTNVSGLLPDQRYFFRYELSNVVGAAWAAESTSFTFLAPTAYGDITFVLGSDSHYGAGLPHPSEAAADICRRALDNMNAVAGQPYPANAGGGVVGLPRGALLAGDLTEWGALPQWMAFTNDWGLNGERLFSFPVYEGFGNHDRTSAVTNGIKARNPLRSALVNISTNGLHYSWDWDFLHLVCLNLFPGNELDLWGYDPLRSLEFLVSDLAANVGSSRRPVVLFHHYGLDPTSGLPSWSEQQRTNYFEAIKNYNVIGILAGHSHSATFVNWRGIDTCTDGTLGKWMGNFLVARVSWTNFTLIERSSSNTWKQFLSKRIWVPGTLAVSNGVGATMLTPSSARLNGQLETPHPPPVSLAVCWGPEDGGTNATAWANVKRWDTNHLGAFYEDVSGLAEETTYYYRCYASNASGPVWAPVSAQFKTPSDFSAWGARMQINLSGYGGQEVLTNFPALIVLNSNRTGFSYSQFASPTGNEIRFSDANGYRLNHEIDEWNTNGNSYVWVQVPRLGGTNTTIWAYWMNLGAAAPPPYATNGATWSEGYAGVWHLKEADAINSVTGTAGTGYGCTATNGLIGLARSFGRDTAYPSIAVGSVNVTNFTMEAWTRSPYAKPPGGRRVLEKAGAFIWQQPVADQSLNLSVQNSPVTNAYVQDGCPELPEPAWNYEALTYAASTAEVKGYLQGILRYAQRKGVGLVPAQNSSPMTISSASLGYYGSLDEVRLSSKVRSSDWLRACHDTVIKQDAFTRYEPALVNTPPVLSPLPDQAVYGGDTFRITNTVSDTESPPHMMTFTLLNAPSRATLGSNNGVLTWKPAFADISTTNYFGVRVSDNGTPPRSATQSFHVVVQPPLLPLHGAARWTTGTWTMATWGPSDRQYTIQASTNLDTWIPVHITNTPPLPFLWTDTNASQFKHRFYRVLLGPPPPPLP